MAGGARCRARASSTTSPAWPSIRRRRRRGARGCAGRADAHARHADTHECAGALRRRGRRGDRASLAERIDAAERAGIARGPDRARSRHRLRQDGRAEHRTCCVGLPELAPPWPARCWSACRASVHRARSPARTSRSAGWPARWPPACSRLARGACDPARARCRRDRAGAAGCGTPWRLMYCRCQDEHATCLIDRRGDDPWPRAHCSAPMASAARANTDPMTAEMALRLGQAAGLLFTRGEPSPPRRDRQGHAAVRLHDGAGAWSPASSAQAWM